MEMMEKLTLAHCIQVYGRVQICVEHVSDRCCSAGPRLVAAVGKGIARKFFYGGHLLGITRTRSGTCYQLKRATFWNQDAKNALSEHASSVKRNKPFNTIT